MLGDRVRQAILELMRTNTPRQVTICKVVSVDEEKLTCTVQELESGQELFQVRLNAASTALQTVLIPKVDSIVLVGLIGNNRQSRFVAMVSEVDKIYLNGGENGGLIIIGDLVTKLNNLVTEVNALKSDYVGHTHPTAATGPPSVPSIPFTGTFSQFSKDDFENKKIKH